MHEKPFERQAQFEHLYKRVGGLKEGYRQNIAIIGDEMVGKTTLLIHFINNYCDPRTLILYLEARPENYFSFARRFVGVLLYTFLQNSGIALKEDLEFLILKASTYLPRTTEKIRGILSSFEKRKKNYSLTDLFSLTDLLHEESGKYCVVMIDEFHHLESMEIPGLYSEWSKLLISQRNTLYIITSSLKFKARAILAKHLSLLFGNFEIVALEPFDIKTSESYLAQCTHDIAVPAAWQNFLIHFTGGVPFYLDILVRALQTSKDKDPVDILEDVLFEPSGLLHQRFSNYLKRFDTALSHEEHLALLYGVAGGHTTIKELAQTLHTTQIKLKARINRLLENDSLAKSGDFLTINDRVFGFWLGFVHQQQRKSLTFDASAQKELFRSCIRSMAQDFFTHTQKPIAQRMAEVFHLFGNDIIQLDAKRVKLDRFREIKPLLLNTRSLHEGIICRSQDSVWITAFKREFINEEDITDFSKECKKYRNTLQRKIIVTNSFVETNARLRALEEKIWTWDLNNVNRLFDVYSKPRVIA